jgi:ubiquinone/menaquinone biosynthesis C-methylase UbiE
MDREHLGRDGQNGCQGKAIDYELLAGTYARYRAASPRILSYLARAAATFAQPALLDVGCGTGDFCAALGEVVRPLGGRCVGFDISPAMLQSAHSKHPDQVLELKLGDAAGEWPYGDGQFDIVFSVNMIHYVRDLDAYFGQACRVLRPGGLAVTVTDSEEDIANRTMTRYFPDSVEHERRRYHPIADLERAMASAGFSGVGADHTSYAGQMEQADLDRYRNRIFSGLQLISDLSFAVGLARLERDYAAGKRDLVELYTYVRGRA